MLIDCKFAAKLLMEHDNIVIFAHRKPDGDAIGSAFALLHALESLGKKARVECADPILHGRFLTLFKEYVPAEFDAEYLVTVDVADMDLLAGAAEKYGRKIDLCIDHHKSNSCYAGHTLLDAEAAAAAEIIYYVIKEMPVELTPQMADAIFLGLTTDTGGFRFSNTTSCTHIVAAGVIAAGADSAYINRLMFETKTKGRLKVEKLMLETMQYYFDGRCAVIFFENRLAEKYGIVEEELDGASSFPRTVEGVMAGVTIREKDDSTYRISLRTHSPVDSSRICAHFGGGGHMAAAGCTMEGKYEEVLGKILGAVEKEFLAVNL